MDPTEKIKMMEMCFYISRSVLAHLNGFCVQLKEVPEDDENDDDENIMMTLKNL